MINQESLQLDESINNQIALYKVVDVENLLKAIKNSRSRRAKSPGGIRAI